MSRSHYLIVTALVLGVLAAFWQVGGNDFITYDDGLYVTRNSRVQAGVTLDNVLWALTATRENNWHPVTWISHMLDWELFGPRPGGHHLTSLLLHVLNTVLLFLLLSRMTGSVWRSGFVAALFGVHPLHVESVAWIAERKDVLSVFFGMLAMLAYVRYVERPSVGRYLPVVLIFALGLMSKPMLVTLPFVLLLLDYWPLGRVGAKYLHDNLSKSKTSPANALPLHPVTRYSSLVTEKIPLLLMSVGSCVITYIAQGEAVSSFERLPFGARAANAAVAYVSYVLKMLWPRDLAIFYPYPATGIPTWQVVGAVVVLIGISSLALRAGRPRPYMTVGCLWYLGTLVPVIGLVQVGAQSMADRYTYIPLIGLFMALGWAIPELMNGRMWEREKGRARAPILPFPHSPILPFASGLALIALTACTCTQVGYWRNSATLFRRALAVTESNYLAHNNLGAALEEAGELDEAAYHYRWTIRLRPDHALAYNNLGNIYVRLGRPEEAVKQYERAVALKPSHAPIHNNLGLALTRLGRLKEAEKHYRTAIRLRPDYAKAHLNLGIVLVQQRRFEEALDHLSRAAKGYPKGASEAHNNIGVALAQQNRTSEAIREFSEAIRLRSSNVEAHRNLAFAYFMSGEYAKAWQEAHACVRYGCDLHPGFLKALSDKMPDPYR